MEVEIRFKLPLSSEVLEEGQDAGARACILASISLLERAAMHCAIGSGERRQSSLCPPPPLQSPAVVLMFIVRCACITTHPRPFEYR